MKGVCVLKVGVFCCYFLLLFCPQEFADWVCCVLDSWGLWFFGSQVNFIEYTKRCGVRWFRHLTDDSTVTPWKFNIAPEKWWLGRLLSWEGDFSGAMLNFGRVTVNRT